MISVKDSTIAAPSSTSVHSLGMRARRLDKEGSTSITSDNHGTTTTSTLKSDRTSMYSNLNELSPTYPSSPSPPISGSSSKTIKKEEVERVEKIITPPSSSTTDFVAPVPSKAAKAGVLSEEPPPTPPIPPPSPAPEEPVEEVKLRRRKTIPTTTTTTTTNTTNSPTIHAAPARSTTYRKARLARQSQSNTRFFIWSAAIWLCFALVLRLTGLDISFAHSSESDDAVAYEYLRTIPASPPPATHQPPREAYFNTHVPPKQFHNGEHEGTWESPSTPPTAPPPHSQPNEGPNIREVIIDENTVPSHHHHHHHHYVDRHQFFHHRRNLFAVVSLMWAGMIVGALAILCDHPSSTKHTPTSAEGVDLDEHTATKEKHEDQVKVMLRKLQNLISFIDRDVYATFNRVEIVLMYIMLFLLQINTFDVPVKKTISETITLTFNSACDTSTLMMMLMVVLVVTIQVLARPLLEVVDNYRIVSPSVGWWGDVDEAMNTVVLTTMECAKLLCLVFMGFTGT